MVWFCLRNSSKSLDLKNAKLLSCMHAQWYLTLCDLMDCSSSGFPNHGVLQARILECHAVSSSRGSSQPKGWICVSCIGRQILYPEPPGKPQFLGRFSFLLIKSGWKKSVFLWCYFLFGYVYVSWWLFVTTYWKTWASLVAQWWKNPPASAGDIGSIPQLERSPGKGMVTHSNILAWKIPWMKELMVYSPRGHKELDITEQLNNNWGIWALKSKIIASSSSWQRMRQFHGIINLMDMFEQSPGIGDGQGSLVCCSPWGRKDSDMTEWLNWSE